MHIGSIHLFIVFIIWINMVQATSHSTSVDFPKPRRQQRSNRGGRYDSHDKEFVCSSIDVRNSVKHFQFLTNCTVIEGSLQILLIDYADWQQYEHISFPALREITDYLLLYRVYGLKTLSHIFPNLSVIRGQKLFFNYALVSFEMPDLEELGLHGLTYIGRGAVRLEKNRNLCYINTIDFLKIAKQLKSEEDSFIMDNKELDECPNNCPRDGEGINICETKKVDNRNQPLCWTANHCQKVCPNSCNGAPCHMRNGHLECCHEYCVGGCNGIGPADCFACRDVIYKGRCTARCIDGTYTYKSRRCILEDECKGLEPERPSSKIAWKLFHNVRENIKECIPDCPPGYMEEENNPHYCKKCKGLCPRICQGIVVDNVAAAQKLKGCTQIHGILEIQIRGGSHVGKELEDNLGQIEEVTQQIKIVRSYAIVSLSFLKNLRHIRGERAHFPAGCVPCGRSWASTRSHHQWHHLQSNLASILLPWI